MWVHNIAMKDMYLFAAPPPGQYLIRSYLILAFVVAHVDERQQFLATSNQIN